MNNQKRPQRNTPKSPERHKEKSNRRRTSFTSRGSADDRFTKISVGNLNYQIDEAGIYKLFTKFGKVGKIEVIRDKKTQQSKGIAFLQMFNREHAENSIQKLNGSVVDGRTLKVSVALERSKK